jgi:predicted PurR-regulated permease PerM
MRAETNSNGTLIHLATLILAVVALYFGKPVLMPLALATLFAFLLSPVVNALARTGLKQPMAVLLVVVLMFSILGATIWGFGRQLGSLAYELPNYRQNIAEKIGDLRSAGSGSALQRIRQTWRELKGELRKPATSSHGPVTIAAGGVTNAPAPEPEPVPVVVKGQSQTNYWEIPTALGPLAEVLATVFLVFVLVVFMLLRRRELRNRLVLLFGFRRLPTTTRALDEAAERISRYLLMQSLVNSTYGLAVGVSLYFIGLPYALMWGLAAAVLRFIPYVGTWIGAAMPICVSLAVFPGWLHALLVLGVIAVLEIINNSFLEPLLYGQSAGVSEVALLVAIAFWTWIWGPIGLVLATPLTVCLVVLGKYVPGLSLLTLLLGDDAVMEPPVEFYQRLLAMDDVEAGEIVQKFGKDHELIDVYDQLLLPALVRAKHDYVDEKLSTDHLDFIVSTAGQLISKTAAAAKAAEAEKEPDATVRVENPQEVFGVPIEDTIDELIMCMLANVLPASLAMRTISAEALTGEMIEHLEQNRPGVVCLGAVAPGAERESRYAAKRILASFPNLPVVIARWGMHNEKKLRDTARNTGINHITTDLKQTRNYLSQLAQITPEVPAPERERPEHELAPA